MVMNCGRYAVDKKGFFVTLLISIFNRRSRIQKAEVKHWPGNNFPNFRLAEEKTKLDELANSLQLSLHS